MLTDILEWTKHNICTTIPNSTGKCDLLSRSCRVDAARGSGVDVVVSFAYFCNYFTTLLKEPFENKYDDRSGIKLKAFGTSDGVQLHRFGRKCNSNIILTGDLTASLIGLKIKLQFA